MIYLGPAPVPHAAEAIRLLRQRDVRVGFVTNNAARPPEAVAAHLRELGVPAEVTDVVTSAQAGARMLAERFGPGSAVLAVGGPGVYAALREADLVPVESADDQPVAVMQGYGPDLTWDRLNEAAIAVQHGAHWLATNTDSTRPTDRGIVPGNGAAVAAVRTAVSVDPEVAGKPYRPLIAETLRRLGAQRAIFVGDRTDTDIEGAYAVGLDSLLVFTGAHGVADLIQAQPPARPTAIGWDIRALLEPARAVAVTETGDGAEATCGASRVRLDAGSLSLATTPADRAASLDAGWAAAQLAWRAADENQEVDAGEVTRRLQELLHQYGAK